jgi:hypothetical protein
MSFIDDEMLKKLIQGRKELCLSIYIPTEKTGRETEQNKIRLKNMLAEAENRLKQEGLRDNEIGKILDPARSLLNNTNFWRYQKDGLALFLSENENYIYRLPLKVEEIINLSHRFHLKQILPLVADGHRIAILALSQKDFRLYLADRLGMEQVDLGDVATDIEDILKYDDIEQQLQHHTSNAPSEGGDSEIFHGHGGQGDEEHKKDILRFFQQAENAVTSFLDNRNLPLLLVGLDHLIGIYRKANSYQYLLDRAVDVNPDDLSEDELHRRSLEAVESLSEEDLKEDMEQYNRLSGTGKAVNELQEVIKASYVNRIHTLFVQKDRRIYGRYDRNWHDVIFQPQDKSRNVDLIDSAAVNTLTSGGRVHFLDMEEMPEKSMLAAVMRY